MSAALCRFSSLCGNVPLNYLSSPGAQLHENDERRAVGFLLPQQLQGTGCCRSHESKPNTVCLMISNDFNRAADRTDIQLNFPLFSPPDCEGSVRGPHSVRQEGCPFRSEQ